MKKIVLAFLVLTSMGCFAQKKGAVKLEILDQNLYYYDYTEIDSNPKLSELRNWKLKDSIVNFSKNIITYKITNNSNNKYFFVMNDDNFTDINNVDYKTMSNKDYQTKVQMAIINSNKKNISPSLKGEYITLRNPDNVYCLLIRDSLENANYVNKNYNRYYKNIKKYGFVLYPKESKTFKTVVYLPFSSRNRDNFEYWDYFYPNVSFEDQYYFQLIFKNNIGYINSYMPNENYEELLKNGVKIYDGELKSNVVLLKPKTQ